MSHLTLRTSARLAIAVTAVVGFFVVTSLLTPSSSTAGSLGVEETDTQLSSGAEGESASLGTLQSPLLNISILASTDQALYTAIDPATGDTIAERFTAEQSASLLSDYSIDINSLLSTPTGETAVPVDEF